MDFLKIILLTNVLKYYSCYNTKYLLVEIDLDATSTQNETGGDSEIGRINKLNFRTAQNEDHADSKNTSERSLKGFWQNLFDSPEKQSTGT